MSDIYKEAEDRAWAEAGPMIRAQRALEAAEKALVEECVLRHIHFGERARNPVEQAIAVIEARQVVRELEESK